MKVSYSQPASPESAFQNPQMRLQLVGCTIQYHNLTVCQIEEVFADLMNLIPDCDIGWISVFKCNRNFLLDN
jgi:hypothetical protein